MSVINISYASYMVEYVINHNNQCIWKGICSELGSASLKAEAYFNFTEAKQKLVFTFFFFLQVK